MPTREQIIGDINSTIDGAVNQFNKSIPKIEGDLTKSITNIIKDLDTTPGGDVKTTIKNLRKMGEIEREMGKAFQSKEYLNQVDEFTSSYNAVRGLETQYFNKVLTEFAEPSIMDEITRQSINEVTDALTGSNIVANVIDPVNKLVRQGIESGMEWDDLRSSISGFLQGAEGTKGALDRYTTTITNDSLNTYARTYENYIADREGIDWFEYVGREVTDTREFCHALDGVRWFKRSDIPDLIAGRVHNYTQRNVVVNVNGTSKTYPSGGTNRTRIYRKTGKPYGMKAETTPGNFIQLAGGWNCGHHAYPVPDHLVPDEIKNGGVDDAVESVTPTTTDNVVYQPQKTIFQAEQFAKENGLAKRVNYKKIPIEGANAVNKKLVDLKNKTGHSYDEIKTMRRKNLKDAGTLMRDVGHYDANGNYTHSTLEINGGTYDALMEHRESINRQYKIDIKPDDDYITALDKWTKVNNEQNWWVQNKWADATDHEFGHLLTRVETNYDDAVGRNKLMKWYGDRSISKYAGTHGDETLAETFSLYQSKGIEALTPEQVEFFNKYSKWEMK
jgi:hypothetical protein